MSDGRDEAGFESGLLRIGRQLALGQLAPGVVHELNNPLFAILGLLEFQLAETPPGTKGHERLQLVQQSALEIKEIVRTILEFAREHVDERGEVSLAAAAGEAARLFRRTSVARDLELAVEARDDAVDVLGSPNRLKQLFLALYQNAHQAMPGGGTVTVEVSRDGGAVVALVRDTGGGVAPEALPRLFEPFFTTRGDAPGLGLALARAVARDAGGELELASTGPEGACFRLRLPAA